MSKAGLSGFEKDTRAEVLIDDDALRITFDDGDADHAVIALAGIGSGAGGVQIPEFQKSLLRKAPTYYVIDRTRRWYMEASPRIIDIIGDHLLHRRIASAATIGNSMGGFGAILLAELMPGICRSLAFCPQSSMCAQIVPWETRWPELVSEIPAWPIADLVPMLGRAQHHVVFGEDDPFDKRHAERLAASPAVRTTSIDGCGHNVAAALKQRGQLGRILAEILVPPQGAT